MNAAGTRSKQSGWNSAPCPNGDGRCSLTQNMVADVGNLNGDSTIDFHSDQDLVIIWQLRRLARRCGIEVRDQLPDVFRPADVFRRGLGAVGGDPGEDEEPVFPA